MAGKGFGFSLEIPDNVLNKLDDADKKILKLAEDSEKASTRIISSFSEIDKGIDPFINKIKLLQESINNLSLSNLKGLSGVGTSFSDNSEDINKFSSALVKAIEALNKLSSKVSTKGITVVDSRQNVEISKLSKEVERLSKAYDKLSKQKSSDRQADKASTAAMNAYNRAMAASEGTITQRINKLAKLRNVEEQLTKTGRDYSQELAKIRTEMTRLNAANENYSKSVKKVEVEKRKLMDTAGQLTRKLALVFSVSQISGYVNKLISVRGQFELQNKALEAILKNKDQADILFGRITELAVASPFTIKELVTYTKQMAAYRIETEKLYDSTRMLADVSSGLGVDMGRLVLAFGQVKTANYLRGQELRQFSEAGINILGELATMYSELEDRMVSVGEVFDRVSNRMVKFGDVEEVFRRVTSAGGIFYQMQEKQADTLAGMMSNLEDEIDLMFNSIGKANETTIKDMVELFKSAVNNWRTIANIITTALTSFVAYKTVFFVANGSLTKMGGLLSKNIRYLIQGVEAIRLKNRGLEAATITLRRFNKAAAANIYALGAAVILGVVNYIYEKIKDTKRVQEELNKVVVEGEYNATRLAANFERLADTILDTSANSKENKDALAELKRTYKDILPEQDLTISGLKDMAGNYDLVTQAIYAKIEAQTKEKQIQIISQEQGEEVQKRFMTLRKTLKDEFKLTTEDATSVIRQFQKAVENGTLKAGDDYGRFIEDIIKRQTGLVVSMRRTLGSVLHQGAEEWVDVIQQRKDVSSLVESMFKLQNSIEEIGKTSIGLPADTRALRNSFNAFTEEVINPAKKTIEESGEDAIVIAERLIEKEKELIGAWTTEIKSGTRKIFTDYGKEVDVANKSTEFFIESLQKGMDSLDGTSLQKQVKGIVFQFLELNKNVKASALSQAFVEADEAGREYEKRINGLLEAQLKLIDDMERGFSPYITNLETQEQIKGAKDLVEVLRLIQKLMFPPTPKKNEGTDIFKTRLDLIKKAGDEYKKLLKYYDQETAKLKTQESYKKAFEKAGIGSMIATMEFDPSGIIDAIETVTKAASEKVKIEAEENIAGMKAQMGINIQIEGLDKTRSQIEDLFAGYELGIELDKLGLDKDLSAQLFGANFFDLEEIKNRLNQIFPDIKKLSEDQLNLYKDTQKKIRDIEDKELKERLKRYANFLTDYESLIEREKLKERKDLLDATGMFEEGKFSVQQYSTVISKIIDDTNKNISKINADKFKESSEYIKSMGDLSIYSSRELENMINKIQELINASAGNIKASDLKIYNDAISKMQDQLRKIKNPFDKYWISSIKELKKLENDLADEKENYNMLLEEQADKTFKLRLEEERLQDLKNKKSSGDTTLGLDQQISESTENIQNATQSLANTNNQISISEGKMSNIGGKISQITQGAKSAMAMIDMIIKGIYQSIKATIELFESFKELASSMGEDTESGFWQELSQGAEVMESINNNVMSSWEKFKSGDFAGAGVDAMKSIIDTFTILNKQHDKRREKSIQNEIKRLKEIERAYQDLNRGISKGLSLDIYKRSSEQFTNIQSQIESYQSMIASERNKKKVDEERIKEWEYSIKDLFYEVEDLYDELRDELVGNFKSISDSFGDSLIDAFAQGKTAAEDWGDAVNEIVSDILKKMLIQKFLEPELEKVFDNYYSQILPKTAEAEKAREKVEKAAAELENAKILGDSKKIERAEDKYSKALSDWNKANEKATGETPKITEDAARQFAESLKASGEFFQSLLPEWMKDYIKTDVSELSNLQKGIQGLSESTAEALEALLNSIRFISFDSNSHLKEIIASFSSTDQTVNPMYYQLKMQTEILTRIDNRLASVISMGHVNGGYGIKSII